MIYGKARPPLIALWRVWMYLKTEERKLCLHLLVSEFRTLIKKWGRRRPNTSMFVLIYPTVFEIPRKHHPTPNFAKRLPRLCCPGETRFPAIKENKTKKKQKKTTYFDPSQDVLGNRSIWQSFIKSSFFFEISQNRFRYRIMYKIKFVDLKFSITYFLGMFWYLEPFLRHSVQNKRKKTPPPLILGKYYPDCAVQWRLSIPS